MCMHDRTLNLWFEVSIDSQNLMRQVKSCKLHVHKTAHRGLLCKICMQISGERMCRVENDDGVKF